MDAREKHPVEEVKRLQRCISDLISTMALPALWSGGDPSQIGRTLVNVLQRMLHLQLIYVQLKDPWAKLPSNWRGQNFLPLRPFSRERSAHNLIGYWETIPRNGLRGFRAALETAICRSRPCDLDCMAKLACSWPGQSDRISPDRLRNFC
jgi:hypothetical protein